MARSLLKSPVATVALFALAAVLLLGGTVGTVQAAPRILANSYRAEVELASVQVALLENGSAVEGDDALLGQLVEPGDTFKIGKDYDEQLSVANTGTADAYVRVTVQRYWTDGQGKAVDLDPALIDLHFVEDGGWSIDAEASTPERTVLYYASPLAPGAASPLFADGLTIDGKVVTSVTKLADGSAEFDYEGVQFRVKATADAVQAHNAEAAMTAAWGRTA